MLSADAAFRMGSTHDVCQDYASASGAAVALSDGCSGAPDTDLGARLLSRTALALAGQQAFLATLGSQAELVARSAIGTLHASRDSLLATLLVARVVGSGFEANCWGDGTIALLRGDTWGGVRIEAPRAAGGIGEEPAYLAYRDHRDQGTYREFFLDSEEGYSEPEMTRSWDCHSETSGSAKAVLIASDGLSSFVDSDRKPVPFGDVLVELLPFRLPGPAFVRRRLAAFERRCKKLGWQHTDDISIAALWRTE